MASAPSEKLTVHSVQVSAEAELGAGCPNTDDIVGPSGISGQKSLELLCKGEHTLRPQKRARFAETANTKHIDITQRLAGRNISLRQLLSLHKELFEKGIVTRTTKTFEFVKDFVIPTSAPERCAFMESSFMYKRGGPKPPYKVLTHWWGADMSDTIVTAAEDASGLEPELLSEMLIDGKILRTLEEKCKSALDRTYWLCFLAVNQHRSICGTESNPCLCGSEHYPCGSPLCEVDKFPAVLSHMPSGLTMSLDPNLEALSRVWCLFELSTALHSKSEMSFSFPHSLQSYVQEQLAAGQAIIPLVEDCTASFQEDKDRILDNIRSTLGFHRFNLEVRALVQMFGPFVTGFEAWRARQAPTPWKVLAESYQKLSPQEKRGWRNRQVDSCDRARFCGSFVDPCRCEMTYTKINGMTIPVIGLPIEWEVAKSKFNKLGEQRKEYDGELPMGMKVYENMLTGSRLFGVSETKEIFYHDFGEWTRYNSAKLIFLQS